MVEAPTIILRDYQESFYKGVQRSISEHKRTVGVLATGGGKSVVIAKLAQDLPGRTLILTHRAEILTQNANWIPNCGVLSSKVNTLKYTNDVMVCMVQTLHARLEKYGVDYLGRVDNIILDEIHILIFEKVFKKYDYLKLIGFTATPVLNKVKTTIIDGVEYVEPYTLSELFDNMVQGPDSQELIDLGYLVQDYNIALKLPDFDKLKESDSAPDGYTAQSLNEVYANTASLDILTKAYMQYGKGKKTIIFNANTKINKFVYEHFLKLGVNVKMFDTKNNSGVNPETGKKWKRTEIIDWFKSERDAVLINTNVFTTGFDVDDVETVFINRATKSLSLWIQMVGRGSRTTKKIFKDMFTVVDLGQNIYEHGIWSEPRNWIDYFYSPGMRPKKTMDLLATWECDKCESLNEVGLTECLYCGAPKQAVVVNGTKKLREGELEQVQPMPKPKAITILNYTKAKGEGSSFAFNLLERKIIDLFIHYKVSKSYYNNRKDDFEARVRRIYMPIYFAIIKSDLKGANRTLDKMLGRVLDKINKIYNN